jgi:hypothetical protein
VLVAVVLLAAAAAALILGAGDHAPAGASVAADGRSPRVPAAHRVRVLVDLRRPSLGERLASEKLDPAAQRAHVASLEGEARALLSALRAKGVKTIRPVIYARAWSGFAVTLATNDLPAVQALGLRSEPVRRFFGAAAELSPAGGARAAAAPAPAGGGRARGRGTAVALLDSGVDRRAGRLKGRVTPIYDAVDRDRDPSPRGRREVHGTAMAGVLAAELPKGDRIASIRVAGRQRDADGAPELEVGTTDQLLAGLERAVDPNGDGAVDDRIPIALVGVSSPYSAFPDSPEAESVRAAQAIGTLVIAPAGNEGPAAGAYGTIGAPAAAPEALAVSALDGGAAPGAPRVDVGLATERGRAKLDGTLLGGGRRALRAPATTLTGPSQAGPRAVGRVPGDDPLQYLAVDARPKARGHVVVVPLRAQGQRPSIAQRAVAAAGAGAAALIVCDPDSSRPPAPLPAGAADGIPVIGLGGDDARRALELTRSPGGLAFLSTPRARRAGGSTRPAAASSRGPTYGLELKPDLAAPGTAETLAPGGAAVFASGSSIAAARVAAMAAALHGRAPRLDARALGAALVGTARPAGPALATGAGRPSVAAAAAAPAVAEPRMVAFPPPPGGAATVRLSNPGTGRVDLRLAATLAGAPGLRVAPGSGRVQIPPGGSTQVELRLDGTTKSKTGFASGRLTARAAGGTAINVPLLVPLAMPPPPKLGGLTTIQRGAQVAGVSFSLGVVRRGAGAIAVEPVGSLRLTIVDPRGKVARELTPPGGAPDLLPGQYSYTLPSGGGGRLSPGEYRFRATARGPSGGTAVAQSGPFTIR